VIKSNYNELAVTLHCPTVNSVPSNTLITKLFVCLHRIFTKS